jgi:hypothetical protein
LVVPGVDWCAQKRWAPAMALNNEADRDLLRIVMIGTFGLGRTVGSLTARLTYSRCCEPRSREKLTCGICLNSVGPQVDISDISRLWRDPSDWTGLNCSSASFGWFFLLGFLVALSIESGQETGVQTYP